MGLLGRLFDRSSGNEPFPPEWLAIIRDCFAPWPTLSEAEQLRLLDLTALLVDDKRWEAANGFSLTDEITVTIAVHAAMLILGLDYGCYRRVTSIIVHPTTIVSTVPRPGPVPFVVDGGPLPMLGEAVLRGPVTIAWDSARAEARHPERGHNVVYHEFAHQLDFLDGADNGAPPFESREQAARWARVCTDAFDRLRDRTDPLLDDYAATNPAEFFAVVTEVFFNRGREFATVHADLYAVLRDFYRQDPARRSGST
ncbi:MAG: M90 family metallopeptidase [Acidimicrobiia bacterium]